MTSEVAAPAAAGKRVAEPSQRDEDGAFQFEPHHCFACGELNEHGLKLEIHTDPTGSWIETTLAPRFQGWDSVAHGGIVCTILDEVMAWALVGEGDWGLTARLSVDFKKTVEVGQPLRADGWVTRSRRRLVDTAGTVVDPRSGTILATATGVYVAADDERKAELRKRYGSTPLADRSTPVTGSAQ